MNQDLSTFRLPPNFRGRSAIIVQLWWIVQGTLFAWSPQFAYSWRNFLLRLFGAKIDKNVILRPTVRVTYPWKLRIGEYSQIGDHVELYTLGEIIIGRNSVISQGCYICTAGHDPASDSFAIYKSPIIIEDNVWLASQCFVMPGVTVKQGTFALVRSLINESTKAGSIVAGSPAVFKGWRKDLTPIGIDAFGNRIVHYE